MHPAALEHLWGGGKTCPAVETATRPQPRLLVHPRAAYRVPRLHMYNPTSRAYRLNTAGGVLYAGPVGHRRLETTAMAKLIRFIRALHPSRSDIVWVAKNDPRALWECIRILWEHI